MMRIAAAVLIAAGVAVVASSAQAAATFDFSAPLTLSPTAAPGAWYSDRYDPATFQSQVSYGGRVNTLSEATSVADGANNRPGAYSGSFYNTQGRTYDLAPGTTSMSIDLYIDPLYASGTGAQRIAGFWGVTDNLGYPIIELDRDASNNLFFQGWDVNLGGWNTLSPVAGALTLGSWTTLGISITGYNAVYSLNGQLAGSAGAYPATILKSAILQTHNSTDGIVDAAHWGGAAVPEPASWALMITGFGATGAMLRRRRQSPMAA